MLKREACWRNRRLDHRRRNRRCAPRAWPSQQFKIVVTYIPGGATDKAGRVRREKMRAFWESR